MTRKAMAAGVALAALLGLAGATEAEDDFESHLLMRGVYDGLLESPSTVPVSNPATRRVSQVPLNSHSWDELGEVSLRSYGAWNAMPQLRLEWNLLGTAVDSSFPISPTAQPLGRSAVLERQPIGESDRQVEVVVDQLNLRWQDAQASLVLGRQVVNLGQNFYFSPLDLFDPFQPQATYRDFRPGVDALRGTWNLGHFTQVEAVGVAGYEPMPEGTNATQQALWLDGPKGQGSLIARGQSGGDSWLATALGGRFAGEGVGGGSLQVETLGSSWTLEALEASSLDAAPGTSQGRSQATLGWTRQWNSWLDTRAEWSELSSTTSQPSGSASSVTGEAAVSATIQATPLWTLAPVLVWFGDPGQALAILDSGYSTSENGSLHLVFELPLIFYYSGGQGLPTRTESLPSALSVDYRLEI
jgi:hypothetical protein